MFHLNDKLSNATMFSAGHKCKIYLMIKTYHNDPVWMNDLSFGWSLLLCTEINRKNCKDRRTIYAIYQTLFTIFKKRDSLYLANWTNSYSNFHYNDGFMLVRNEAG